MGNIKLQILLKSTSIGINEIDKNGPRLNSIIEINPDALLIAEELDNEAATGKPKGPLFGSPVILKDNIDTHDKMPTTAGATVLKNSFPGTDSFVARKLREAGAVIIAKSNLSEWANFRAKMSSSGWSGVGGQTKNPYVLDRNPCGSSSGSGAAVSANLCMVAIGTETNGSIVCPSNNNGIVGIKAHSGPYQPYRYCSNIILSGYSWSDGTDSGRCCHNSGALTGIDSSDSKTIASKGKYLTDYTKFLKKDGLNGKRIGLQKKDMGFSDKVDSLMNKTIAYLKSHGAEVVEVEFPKGLNYEDASYQVCCMNLRTD